MIIEKTAIADVLLIKPKVFADNRGFFVETWNQKVFQEAGLDCVFVQDNHSCSVKGTLRGLHYQVINPQGKLVRVSAGAVFDVAVDLRKSSATFGKWIGQVLSADNKDMLWIPPGFAHGFYVLSEFAEFQYKCTDFYNHAGERCLLWNDQEIGIKWPLNEKQPILSAKDCLGALFANAEVFA